MTWTLQALQFALLLVLAPALTGFVRWCKARLNGRTGPPILQPYRDLRKLLGKESLIAQSAGALYIGAPLVCFALIWLAGGLIPTLSTDLPLARAGDLIVLAALLGAARFVQVLAGLDAGTAFGGIGTSREIMIASLAEPALLMVIFTVALLTRTTALPDISRGFIDHSVGLRVSLAMAVIALVMVAIAENGRIPIDNPATHLELTMVHEAMVLDYSGKELALIEAGAMVKLQVHLSLIIALFLPFGMVTGPSSISAWASALAIYLGKLAVGGAALALFETWIAKMRVFRYPEFLGGALVLCLLATVYLYITREF